MSVVMGALAGALTAGTLLLLASPLLYRGLQHRTRFHRFQDLPVETPATVPDGTPAFITGRAHSHDDNSIEAPVSGEPALLAAWDIHSLRRYHPLGVRYVWAPEALGIDTQGFEIHDEDHRLSVPDWSRHDRIEGKERLALTGTGQMPVDGLDVKGLWIELDTFDTETRVLPDAELPERLRMLSSRVGAPVERPARFLPTLPRLRTPEATLQYREMTVQDGHDVTILGTVDEPHSQNVPRQIVESDDFPPLVSPLTPEIILRRYRRSYWKSIYGLGLIILIVASVVGIGVML